MEHLTHDPPFKITFTPSRVDWTSDVSLVTVWPNRLTVETIDGEQEFQFEQIGKIQESGIMRFMRRLGGAKQLGLLVADRDWFHPPQDRYFRFYTDPPMTVYMPADEAVDYQESVFFRVKAVILCGGFETYDVG